VRVARYCLSPTTYACITDGQAIFLDVNRNKYLALEPANTYALSDLVYGWPSADCPDDSASERHTEPSVTSAQDVANTLLAEGLLTDNASCGKAFSPPALEGVSTTIDQVRGKFPTIDFVHFRRFVRAWALVTMQMKLFPLKSLLRRVQRRREKQKGRAPEFDVLKAHELMTAYFILRPNFFNAHDQCLRDSLTFIEFFASYGLYPTCVFGVKARPFAAHAWVQEGPMVLNDYIPIVTRYTPIMAV
jgi:hypothetical protein